MVESFPTVSIVEIIAVINRTRYAATDFGLPEDKQLEAAEIIVRRQLVQMSGSAERLGTGVEPPPS
jgi:hypothetical protein